jgi:hypothetical protein
MKKALLKYSIAVLLLTSGQWGMAQDSTKAAKNVVQFHGQLSGWTQYNFTKSSQIDLGTRYIPELQYQKKLSKGHLINVDASAYLLGTAHMVFSEENNFGHSLKPYRFWIRYTTQHLEVRLGLQKINFGSANILRPLMWFDKVDARDPLRLSTGVYGALMRYYFPNNANLWIWTLYGNKETKGWELIPSNSKLPEFGGRFQWPLSNGEVAFSYHHRTADSQNSTFQLPSFSTIGENRYGFDIKLDLGIGWWFESTLITKNKMLGMFTHQEMINMGIDYTFGIGNGLNLSMEHLLTSYDQTLFGFNNPVNFTAFSASYPTGIIDNLQTMIYFDWTNSALYRFINWYRQYNKFTLYVMAYWNPEQYQFIYQPETGQNFAGKGIQIMIVYNH